MLSFLDSLTLLQACILFAVCATIIGFAGTRITRIVDQLADRTGIGEAAAGAVLLGASTSLGGSVLSVTAAYSGNTELAVSNALGGIAVQTFFLAIADIVYRRANLKHAAASAPNLMQNGLLICLLSLILIAPYLPEVTFWGIHFITPILFGVYAYGIFLIRETTERPMWLPRETSETVIDEPEDPNTMPSLFRLWLEFFALMIVLGIAGFLLEPSATTIAANTGFTQTLIGVLLTAVSTSIPELVTSIAAVRRKAVTLAVGGIIGGNAFDTLFTAASDIAYRDGSIFHTISEDSKFWVVLTLLMSGILLIGLIRREQKSLANVGTESVINICIYIVGALMLVLSVS